MRNFLMGGIALATLGAIGAAPAEAFPVAKAPTAGYGTPQFQAEQVQYRRHHRGYRYGHRGWRHGHRGYGAGVGAGIAGLAAGAIIGGAIANSQQPAYYGVAPSTDANAVAYCSQRFRSYDPASGTYLGYDGERHPCP